MQRKGKKWGGKLKYNQLAALYSPGARPKLLKKRRKEKEEKKKKVRKA